MNALESPTVLNVDDNEARRYAKSRVLKRGGYQVIESETGAEALRVVKEFQPSIVLLDVKLPDTTGLQYARRLKQTWQPRTSWFSKFRLCT
jgi:CheY-like chemotaxis protein